MREWIETGKDISEKCFSFVFTRWKIALKSDWPTIGSARWCNIGGKQTVLTTIMRSSRYLRPPSTRGYCAMSTTDRARWGTASHNQAATKKVRLADDKAGLKEMVPRHGLEPWTNWLRVSCSTNWANEACIRLFTRLVPSRKMEPLVGIEPTTHALRMRCSTPELQWRREKRASK